MNKVVEITKVVHCKKEPYDVYIGRPSKRGNPFEIGKDGDRDEVCEKHMFWLINQAELTNSIHELYNKRIGCFCCPKRCHGDNLKKLADMPYNNICYFCDNKANGSIGDMYNRKLSLKVCEFCYKHVLHMRPLGFEWTEEYIIDTINNINNDLAIRRYKLRLLELRRKND